MTWNSFQLRSFWELPWAAVSLRTEFRCEDRRATDSDNCHRLVLLGKSGGKSSLSSKMGDMLENYPIVGPTNWASHAQVVKTNQTIWNNIQMLSSFSLCFISALNQHFQAFKPPPVTKKNIWNHANVNGTWFIGSSITHSQAKNT